MSGSGRALAIVWFCSGLAFLPALNSPQVSRAALVLLPWLVWSGWPSAEHRGAPGSSGGWIARVLPALGLAAPLLAIGVELDSASGWSLTSLLRTVGVGLLLVGVGAAARAEFARAGGRAATAYRVFWLLFVLLVPLFASVLHIGAQALGRWGALAVASSPLGWGVGRVTRTPMASAGDLPDGYPSLALVLLAWGAAALLCRRSRT